MATLLAVCASAQKGTAKAEVPSALLVAGHGLQGDAHAGDWHRQVSLLEVAAIDEMRAAGLQLQYGAFGENLVVEGLAVEELGLGSEVQVGTARLVVTQIGKTCHHPCAIFHAVGRCIMPEQGVFMAVLDGGAVSPGDEAVVTRRVAREVIQVAIVTVSDRSARGERADASGPALGEFIERELQAHVAVRLIVPDEFEEIKATLENLTQRKGLDLILTTGGTGCAPRDVTPEATRAVIQREAPGLAEQMRAQSMLVTPRAMLSRAVAGLAERCLIINLPGSPTGAVENLQAVAKALPHAVELLRGAALDCCLLYTSDAADE